MQTGANKSINDRIIVGRWFMSYRSCLRDVIRRPYNAPRIVAFDPGLTVFLTGVDSIGITYQLGKNWRDMMILNTDMQGGDARWSHHRNMVKDMQACMIKYIVEKFDVVILPILDLDYTGIERIDRSIALLKHRSFHRKLCKRITVITPNEMYSSRTCAQCGNLQTMQCNPWNIFRCELCGLESNRDVNAAINIAKMVLK